MAAQRIIHLSHGKNWNKGEGLTRKLLLLCSLLLLLPSTLSFQQTAVVVKATFQSNTLGHGPIRKQQQQHSLAPRYHAHTSKTSNARRRQPLGRCQLGRAFPRLTTTLEDGQADDDDDSPPSPLVRPLQRAVQKFRSRPGTYMLIPCVAALVGWLTNWLAVQMIFYPIQYRGFPISVWRPSVEAPLGLLGWQGIVPCKTRPMAEAMVHMVTSQLMTVQEVFNRLDPNKMAQLLAPRVPLLVKEVAQDAVGPKWAWFGGGAPTALYQGLDAVSQGILRHFNMQFLRNLASSMQQNIDSVFNLRNCVVNQMLQDRHVLGQLFRKCGQKELDFLTNSGLWFGFLLGLIQMVVALFWDNPWSLSIGGGIVGLATNWLALKWIFEPVDPMRIGPFVIQGQFLRRQPEVAREFSQFFAQRILTAERLWHSVLTDPTTQPAFGALFGQHLQRLLRRTTLGFFGGTLEPETLATTTRLAMDKLPRHVPVLYQYMDNTLGIETTLRERMEKMTSRQFERVLHPIFEEDELTLILAGAVLGFGAGLIQQGLETGAISLSPKKAWIQMKSGYALVERRFRAVGTWIKSLPRIIRQRRSGDDGKAGVTKTDVDMEVDGNDDDEKAFGGDDE